MSSKILGFLLLLLFTTSFTSFAKNDVSEISTSDFKVFKLDDVKDQSGILVRPVSFFAPGEIGSDEKNRLPKNIRSQFDNDTRLVTHHVIFKIPKDYKSFTSMALKDRASIEKYLLYNSDVSLDHEDFANCVSTTGSIKSDIALPKFLAIFDYPEKLICNITVYNSGTGKKHLHPDMLSKLPENTKDEDVRFISLHMSFCNMIFKGISQNIYFIKAADGKTLILFDNYSLIKKSTLDKFETVKMFTGSPIKFVNGQVHKNMTGLLKYINSSHD